MTIKIDTQKWRALGLDAELVALLVACVGAANKIPARGDPGRGIAHVAADIMTGGIVVTLSDGTVSRINDLRAALADGDAEAIARALAAAETVEGAATTATTAAGAASQAAVAAGGAATVASDALVSIGGLAGAAGEAAQLAAEAATVATRAATDVGATAQTIAGAVSVAAGAAADAGNAADAAGQAAQAAETAAANIGTAVDQAIAALPPAVAALEIEAGRIVQVMTSGARADGPELPASSGEPGPIPTGADIIDGQRVLTMSDGRTVTLWPVEAPPDPAPTASPLIMTGDGFTLADPAALPPLTITITADGFVAAPAEEI
mgnify:CR=1 FL=1